LRGAETRLGGLRQRPDTEVLAAADLVRVVVPVILAPASGSPSASTYSLRLLGGSGVITAKVERNSIFMQPPC
jgi:hypothetical protein